MSNNSPKQTLTDDLLQIIAELHDQIATLKAEIAQLKGLSSKPKIRPNKPSGMEQKTLPAGQKKKTAKRGRGVKKAKRQITKTVILEVKDRPAGAQSKGFERYLYQDIIIQAENTLYLRQRLQIPGGKTILAPLPSHIHGHFGSELKRFSIGLHYSGQMPGTRVKKLLDDIGVDISLRQVQRFLDIKQASNRKIFADAEQILPAGLKAASWVTVDDTGARHKGKNGYCLQIGNTDFTHFTSTGSKSRLNFLEVLRAGQENYIINDDAVTYMRARNLSEKLILLLQDHKNKDFYDQAEWHAHLQRQGFFKLKTTPDPVQISTEGGLWGAICQQGLLDNTVIVSDGAKQFDVGIHALCWVHAERLVQKLVCGNERWHRLREQVRAKIWRFYATLKNFQLYPSPSRIPRLQRRFERIFRKKTGFTLLDRLLARLYKQKSALLMVLQYPQIPLHTNGSENDIRCYVTKRKISGGTRSFDGRKSRDVFLSVMKTCAKQSVSFWDYLGSRLNCKNAPDIPQIPDLIRQGA